MKIKFEIKKIDTLWTVNGKRYSELTQQEREYLNLFFKHIKKEL